MLKLFRISGNSLAPEYSPGDFVLTSRLPVRLRRLRRGDVIVFRHPVYGRLIKRVEDVAGCDLNVVGSREFSVDSGVIGRVPLGSVLGKVIRHWRRKI